MDDLPPEILEQIFAHVPLIDLLTVHSLVCKKWHGIIFRPNFMPWKKSYFRYMKNPNFGKADPLLKYERGLGTHGSLALNDIEPRRKRPKLEEDEDLHGMIEESSFGDHDMKVNELFKRLKSPPFSNDFINPSQHLYPPS